MKRFFGNEGKYVLEVLESEFRSSKSTNMMQRLENAFAKKNNVNYAIAHTNGTSTLHSILEAMDIGVGDEVIVPPLTMSSTSLAVLQANATPIFADVDPNSFLISPEKIRECITSKTKAIITVSLYGLSPDMDSIMDIANRHNLYVIEDNAQCLFGTYKGKLVGTFGHAASYSFQSSKHITSGEGGIVITNDEKLADNIRVISTLGYMSVNATAGKIRKIDIQNPQYKRHGVLGWNYRMSDLCSAVVLGQLENSESLINARINSAELFLAETKNISWLKPQTAIYDARNTYWALTYKITDPNISWHEFRDKYLEFGGHGIYAAWELTYLEPAFQNKNFLGRENFIEKNILNGYKKGLCPIAESLQPKLLQFRTNYWDLDQAKNEADILRKTLDYFEWRLK